MEVNDYLMSGLVVSPIDKWFMGPVPRFPLTPGFGVPPKEASGDVTMDGTGSSKLDEALAKVRRKLEEGRKGLRWPPVRDLLGGL